MSSPTIRKAQASFPTGQNGIGVIALQDLLRLRSAIRTVTQRISDLKLTPLTAESFMTPKKNFSSTMLSLTQQLSRLDTTSDTTADFLRRLDLSGRILSSMTL